MSSPFDINTDNSFDLSPSYGDRETGVGFYIFLLSYTVFCIAFIAPLVLWTNRYTVAHTTTLPSEFNSVVDLQSTRSVGEHPPSQATSHHQNNTINSASNHSKPPLIRSVVREIDRVVTQDEDGDSQSQFSTSLNGLLSIHRSQTSAATTSRLWTSTPRTQICDVGRRRWKQRRPIGRHIHQHYKEETASMGGSSYSRGRRGGNHELVSINQRTNNSNMSKGHMMSDVASSILTDDLEGPPIGANSSGAHRVIIHCQHHRRTVGRHRFRRSSGSSRSMASSDQMLSAVNPDDISPNDAADAGDPGRVNSLQYVEQLERQREVQRQEMINVCCGPAALWKPRTIMAAIDGLVALSEPDMELKRIVAIGIPLTLGAMSTTFFHLVTSAFIANYISTDAMVAYVIVHLLLGLTKELVGSIADAQSTLCSHALSMGDWRLAGQYAQIAIIFMVLVNIPILFLWGNYMEGVVHWMVDSPEIARLALPEYTQVVQIWQLFLQGLSRSFTVLFHLTGHEAYETQCALGEALLQMLVVTCVAGLKKDEATLGEIGGIQFILAMAFFIAKITNAFLRRWLRIFYVGMCRTCALRNVDAVFNLCRTTFPLLIGAFLEYGEWELLLFLVVSLGPAEVATWAMLGTLWKLLEISTEGFGEAASIRVAYHLGTPGQEPLAQLASHKALLVTTFQSLLLSSVLLMAGPQIARLLTPDTTLRVLFNNLMTTLALANLVLHAAMTFWSLLGAQGRYRLATLVMLLTRYLVTMPMAALCIYAWNMDLNAVLGSVTTGLSTSVLLLGYIFFRSDWERLAKIMQELNALLDVSEEEEDDNDDDDDFGFGEDVEEMGLEQDPPRRQVPPLQASTRSSPEQFMSDNLEERLEIPY
eukprot:CAMPEP_0178926540 /NCGR_PEP_ID=MMETSP0786-20121207/18602_1 /TAXON_ID=186022 /ORGANISM="Thalassionema frauenfeldii, Strain CCMP 1798" /LENGTH=873 /DNA_ID=CAMNT_0020601699 /DNA_START=249 /DNA_END=2870 /DNA_ORIENTATION=-